MLSKILWIREHFPWMGAHSGYDLLCKKIEEIQPSSYFSFWNKSLEHPPAIHKILFHLISKHSEISPVYNPSSTVAELSATLGCLMKQPQVVHLTYAEKQLGILPYYKQKLSFKLVGTAHQPTSWWRLNHLHPESIAGLDALIVPSSNTVSYFEEFLPGHAHFIPHGVDTDFFYPLIDRSEASKNRRPRCVFAGMWLRDFPTLTRVIEQVLKHNPGVCFDIVLPRSKRNDPLLYQIARHDQVFWHANVSDEQLRDIYQQATVFLLPLLDCTANNAVLEAIACGLPILSNNVGGMPDYTTPSFAHLFSLGDVDGFTNTILELVDDSPRCQKMSTAARTFAEQNLTWSRIAQETLEVYHSII